MIWAEFQKQRPSLEAIIRFYAPPFLATYLVTLIAYSYFFTHIGFTNHTLPHVLVYSYPSFKTWLEGRWFADLIIQATGGNGAATFQMAIAAGIQIVNAFLFAAIFRVADRPTIFVISLFMALHPAFLDYYSFSIDHISFTLGDCMVLCGVLAMDRGTTARVRWLLPIALFVLALATYQPKIALIATMLIAWSLTASVGTIYERIARSGGVISASVAIYFVTSLLVVQHTGHERQNISDLGQVIAGVRQSYGAVFSLLATRVDYLPSLIRYLPAIFIAAGLIAVLIRSRRNGWQVLLASIALLGALPPALQLTFIVNIETFPDWGRILFVHAYFLSFIFVTLISFKSARAPAYAAYLVMIGFFAVIAVQESNASAVREIFNRAKINRVVARVENAVQDLGGKRYPLVVIGNLTLEPGGKLTRFPNAIYRSFTRTEPFINFRHIEVFNFFAGRASVVMPTVDQVKIASEEARNRRPWPSSESVFQKDGIIVVVLAPYTGSVGITTPQ
ncbi:MAG: hypothetical protein Q7V17_15045 [Afipia sp.]|nr:hypothetical protein [Afipia sp.]